MLFTHSAPCLPVAALCYDGVFCSPAAFKFYDASSWTRRFLVSPCHTTTIIVILFSRTESEVLTGPDRVHSSLAAPRDPDTRSEERQAKRRGAYTARNLRRLLAYTSFLFPSSSLRRHCLFSSSLHTNERISKRCYA